MAVLRDFYCPNCGEMLEDVYCELEARIFCEECATQMKPICANRGGFVLKYDPKKDTCGWSWDGYAKSQYYRKVDEMNEKEGKIISGAGYTGKSHVYKGHGE